MALCCLPLVAVHAAPVSSRGAPSRIPTPLRITDTIAVGENVSGFFVGLPHCDSGGNVFFLSVVPDSGAFKRPDTVVRISADGQKTTRFTLASVPGLGSVADAGIHATALDVEGSLYVLATAAIGQYIVSFDSSGRYRSKTEIDPDEIVIGSFAVFASGEFLLTGYRPPELSKARVAILAAGSPIRDVTLPDDPQLSETSASDYNQGLVHPGFLETSSDGQVYFVPRTSSGSVFAISRTGEVGRKMELVLPRRGATLSSIKLSGHRLSATYEENEFDEELSKRWVSVHDLISGDELALYGPLPRNVICYRSVDGFPDQFTLLNVEGSQMQLLRAWAP